MAAESLCRAQNEGGLLPLNKTGQSIAVIGPMIHQRTALLGSWTLDGISEETQTIAEAMHAAAPQAIARRANDALSDEMVRAALSADLSVVFVWSSPTALPAKTTTSPPSPCPPARKNWSRPFVPWANPWWWSFWPAALSISAA